MPNVDLGFSNKTLPWKLNSEYFPSKIGGLPSWLSQNLTPSINLTCDICNDPCIFLIQLYSPFSEHFYTFHRTIYIFICRNPNCCKQNSNKNIKVLRSQLPRENKFYSIIPPDYDNPPLNLYNLERLKENCALCGCYAEKKCSKCNFIKYCSKKHQVIHWKLIHKSICSKQTCDVIENFTKKSDTLFNEFELLINENCDEDISSSDDDQNDGEDDDLNKKLCASYANKNNEYSEKELETMSNSKEDKFFNQFRNLVKKNPDQVIRYERGGQPLWITDKFIPEPSSIPNCPSCSSVRQFEFQIMPHLVKVLELDDVGLSLDWGTICIYTCKISCEINEDLYVPEYAYKQDIVDDK